MNNPLITPELVWEIIELKRRLAENNIDTMHLVYMPKVPFDFTYSREVIFWEVMWIRVWFLISSPND